MGVLVWTERATEGDEMSDKCVTYIAECVEDFRGANLFPFDEAVAQRFGFVLKQINQSVTVRPFTIRGLHYQEAPYEQAKLVQCVTGSIFNVAVDIRRDSTTFGKCFTEVLSGENHKIMYIPRGYAHGFMTLEPNTFVQWCVDNEFCKDAARCIRWDSVGVEWPEAMEYVVGERDKGGVRLEEV